MGATLKDPTITIRLATPEDRPHLVRLFLNYLHYIGEYGGDMLPTQENAEKLVDEVFLPAAARGEPILLAWAEGQAEPIAATFAVIQELPYKMRWRQAWGYGTYVDPDWRSRKVGTEIRRRAKEILKKKGVECVIGMAYEGNEIGLNSAEKDGTVLARVYRVPL